MAFVILFVVRIPFRKVKRKGEAEEATFFGMLEQGRVKAQKKKNKKQESVGKSRRFTIGSHGDLEKIR